MSLKGLQLHGGSCLYSLVCIRISAVGAIECLIHAKCQGILDDIATSELSLEGHVKARWKLHKQKKQHSVAAVVELQVHI